LVPKCISVNEQEGGDCQRLRVSHLLRDGTRTKRAEWPIEQTI